MSLEASHLEKTERLEQLRGIQDGMNIWAVPVKGDFMSVDVKEDLDAVLKYLKLAN
jgi:CMP-2-keto-3-deoxyoctulosonic acid synthetase